MKRKSARHDRWNATNSKAKTKHGIAAATRQTFAPVGCCERTRDRRRVTRDSRRIFHARRKDLHFPVVYKKTTWPDRNKKKTGSTRERDGLLATPGQAYWFSKDRAPDDSHPVRLARMAGEAPSTTQSAQRDQGEARPRAAVACAEDAGSAPGSGGEGARGDCASHSSRTASA